MTKSIFKLLPLAIGLAMVSNHAHSSGFALIELNASGAGNAFAGGSAIAEDVSTIFFNPAGLTRIPGQQFVIAAHALKSTIHFNNQGSTTTGGALTGGEGGDAGDWTLLPNLYYARDINPRTKVGIGIFSSFGLKTEYDPTWVGRYQAIKSDLKTVNINPTLAYKVNDNLSLGGGLNVQYGKAELTKAIDFSTLCLGTLGVGACTALGLQVPQTRDGSAKLTGDDWAFGYNLGALIQLTPITRVGIAYRSKIKYTLSGNVNYFNVPTAFSTSAQFTNTGAKTNITLPDTLSLSTFHQLNPNWALMADVTWTHWRTFDELRFHFSNGAADSVTPEHWSNTMRYALGATYKHNEAWKFRAGIAYDQSPVPDDHRNPSIPDSDRKWLSFGAGYQLSKAASIDFAYTHIFMKDGPVNHAATASGTIRGKYDSKVDILSVQYTHSF